MEIKTKIDPKTGRPILPLDVVDENQELADSAPDSTKDFSKRPDTWKPPLISPEDNDEEHPYSH